jgi:uncharacterized membrane protein
VDVMRPSSPNRSGSEASLVAWDAIGHQGQNFVGRGPSKDSLRAFWGEEPQEPIRIYAGLKSAATAEERANLAVDELRRTNAFDREILVLATTTGTGWLEPQAVDSIEYMYNGNTAIVAQQYSYLPSWISFLVDTKKATEAGQALFDAVHAEWSSLPENDRPKLIAYGLSLGSFGGQAAYDRLSTLRSSVDGALFIGTPNDTRLWGDITDQRDEGTPQWKPTYQGGDLVRFASNNQDVLNSATSLEKPRVLYLQHASDSVVWFSFDLLLERPDWLVEDRGEGVSDWTVWFPFVTFSQVAIDQFFGTTVPNGHGHNYADAMVSSWEVITSPTNWDQTKREKLEKIILGYAIE